MTPLSISGGDVFIYIHTYIHTHACDCGSALHHIGQLEIYLNLPNGNDHEKNISNVAQKNGYKICGYGL